MEHLTLHIVTAVHIFWFMVHTFLSKIYLFLQIWRLFTITTRSIIVPDYSYYQLDKNTTWEGNLFVYRSMLICEVTECLDQIEQVHIIVPALPTQQISTQRFSLNRFFKLEQSTRIVGYLLSDHLYKFCAFNDARRLNLKDKWTGQQQYKETPWPYKE